MINYECVKRKYETNILTHCCTNQMIRTEKERGVIIRKIVYVKLVFNTCHISMHLSQSYAFINLLIFHEIL